MKKKFTHTGFIRGYDARTPEKWKQKVMLRKTMRHWVTQYGTKYRKDTGRGMGEWPLYCLDLETIKEIGDET